MRGYDSNLHRYAASAAIRVKNAVSKRDVFWNTVGSIMWAAISFVMVLFVSRVTDVETVGLFSIALTTAQMLYIVGVFGTNNYQMTDFKYKYQFSDYFWLKILSCAAVAILCAVMMVTTRDVQQRLYILLLSIFMIINAFAGIFQSLLFQRNRLDLSGKFLFFQHFLSLAAFVLVLLMTKQVAYALIVLVVVDAVFTGIWGARCVARFTDSVYTIDKTRLRALFFECLPLFFSIFLMTYLLSISKYAIQNILDSTAQGYFGILFVPVLIVNLCSQFMLKPALNRYATQLEEEDKAPLLHTLLRHGLLIVLFTLLCCGILYAFGVPVINLLYRVDVSAYRWDLAIILLGGGVFALCQILYYILLLQRRQMLILAAYLIVGVAATVLTWNFVRLWALRGASVAFLISHVLLFVVYLIFTVRSVKQNKRKDPQHESVTAS